MLIEDWEMMENYGSEEEKKNLKKKIKIGIFQDIEKPEYTKKWKELIRSFK